MTPAELALETISTRPATVSDLAGKLLSHGVPYLDCVRVAREQLAALVVKGRAELIEVHGCDVYRLPAGVAIAPSQSERG